MRFVCMVPSEKNEKNEFFLRKSPFRGIDEILLEKTDDGQVRPVRKNENHSSDPWKDVSSRMESERVVARISDFLGLNNNSPEDEFPLFVVTNKEKEFGSGELTKSFLEEFMKEKGWRTVICLPSSIHEWLLMEGQAEDSLDPLTSMVREINESEVPPCDRLGERAYKVSINEDGSLIFE